MPFPCDLLDPNYESIHNGYVQEVLNEVSSLDSNSVFDKEIAMKVIDEIIVLGYELNESRMDLYKKAIMFLAPNAKLEGATIPTIRQLALLISTSSSFENEEQVLNADSNQNF